ncbi:UbiA family prenyltransferase [Candidatus Woesearchaeota archaeon]|nr:UbiA family prenyltransferase [Candidatus Woesearchaeota archaeon]
MKILNIPKKIISNLENSKAPFIYFILTFLFAITLRTFLELFSDPDSGISYIPYLHYYSYWIALAMSLILLFYLITNIDIIKIAKVILPSFIIINLAPLLDLILSKGRGYDIAYTNTQTWHNLIFKFFTFFGNFKESGVTHGMRIEIAIVLCISFIYFYIKNSNFLKSLINTLLVYTLIFISLATPLFVAKMFFSGANSVFDLIMINFLLTIIFLTGIGIAYLKNEAFFQIIIKDIRFFRLIHYELMFILGIILGLKYNVFSLTNENIFYFIFIPISIVFAWIYSVMTNNIEDYEIDKISNKQRPLIKSRIDIQTYTKLSWFFLFIALFYAAMVNFKAFFIILLFIGNYFLYSMPPFRLKRIPFFSKLFISLNSLILIMLGFIIITGSIQEFPKLIIAIFLIGFTAVINFIDIKDYEGDKKEGIKTLPVILGLKKSKFIIGLFFILTYLSVYFIVKESYMLIPLFVLGIIQFYLINKRDYKEWIVFTAYLSSLTMLFCYLVIFKPI